jgi:hypothetical protein
MLRNERNGSRPREAMQHENRSLGRSDLTSCIYCRRDGFYPSHGIPFGIVAILRELLTGKRGGRAVALRTGCCIDGGDDGLTLTIFLYGGLYYWGSSSNPRSLTAEFLWSQPVGLVHFKSGSSLHAGLKKAPTYSNVLPGAARTDLGRTGRLCKLWHHEIPVFYLRYLGMPPRRHSIVFSV